MVFEGRILGNDEMAQTEEVITRKSDALIKKSSIKIG